MYNNYIIIRAYAKCFDTGTPIEQINYALTDKNYDPYYNYPDHFVKLFESIYKHINQNIQYSKYFWMPKNFDYQGDICPNKFDKLMALISWSSGVEPSDHTLKINNRIFINNVQQYDYHKYLYYKEFIRFDDIVNNIFKIMCKLFDFTQFDDKEIFKGYNICVDKY